MNTLWLCKFSSENTMLHFGLLNWICSTQNNIPCHPRNTYHESTEFFCTILFVRFQLNHIDNTSICAILSFPILMTFRTFQYVNWWIDKFDSSFYLWDVKESLLVFRCNFFKNERRMYVFHWCWFAKNKVCSSSSYLCEKNVCIAIPFVIHSGLLKKNVCCA